MNLYKVFYKLNEQIGFTLFTSEIADKDIIYMPLLSNPSKLTFT